MKRIAALAITLALLLSFTTLSGPTAHAEENEVTLFDVLRTLADYYNSEATRAELDQTVDAYMGGSSGVNIDSVTNPTVVYLYEFYYAYNDQFDNPICGDTYRPPYNSQMYFRGVAWRCTGGQWELVSRSANSWIPPTSTWIPLLDEEGNRVTDANHRFYDHPTYEGTLSLIKRSDGSCPR